MEDPMLVIAIPCNHKIGDTADVQRKHCPPREQFKLRLVLG
jgi:hypothetical protein